MKSSKTDIVYFDNAATSFPKPPSVTEAVDKCIKEYCGNPGRSSHSLSRASSEVIFECRSKLCSFFNYDSPENVVFTLNATYALNIAIKAFCRRGDHVIISNTEHNSVIRPLYACGARVSVFNSFAGREEIIEEINNLITPSTVAVVCSHVSNICSIDNPVYDIAALCRKRKIKFICDASQSAGIYDIDINEMKPDALCVPAHKALYGIQGLGFLIFGSGCDTSRLPALAEGGNGVDTFVKAMPPYMPERFEAGTLPTPAVAALCAGLDFVSEMTPYEIHYHEAKLGGMISEYLLSLQRVTLYPPTQANGGTVLFSVDSLPSEEVAGILDRHGICVRAGFHCSPLAHRALHTPDLGAVRVSFGVFNTTKEVERFYRVMRQYVLI